jgi:Fe-S cluster biosynthesis and repair protein YggX
MDEQHIQFQRVFIPRASGRDIFKALLEKAWFKYAGDGTSFYMDELGNKMNADESKISSLQAMWDTVENIK